MGFITRLETAAEYAVRLREEAAADQRRKKAAKKEDVMRLVEARSLAVWTFLLRRWWMRHSLSLNV